RNAGSHHSRPLTPGATTGRGQPRRKPYAHRAPSTLTTDPGPTCMITRQYCSGRRRALLSAGRIPIHRVVGTEERPCTDPPDFVRVPCLGRLVADGDVPRIGDHAGQRLAPDWGRLLRAQFLSLLPETLDRQVRCTVLIGKTNARVVRPRD